MKCTLGISHFLKEISSLFHSIVFFYFFAMITLHWSLCTFLYLLLFSGTLYSNGWVYLSFSPVPFACLFFIAVCKASSDNHFAFLHFFFWMIVFITAVKVLHLICQQIWKTQKWPQDWKRSVFIPIPNKGNAKECSNYPTIAPISHTSKAMLKILQGRLQQCVKQELPDVQVWFRKGRETRDQIANIHWIIEKAREFQKTSTTVSLTT